MLKARQSRPTLPSQQNEGIGIKLLQAEEVASVYQKPERDPANMQQDKINAASEVRSRVGDIVKAGSIAQKPALKIRDCLYVAFRRARQMPSRGSATEDSSRTSGSASALKAIAGPRFARGIGRFGYESHFAIAVALEAMRLIAAIA